MNEKREILMEDGCPIDLENPMDLYEKLKAWLASIGQLDGRWSAEGKQKIPSMFRETPLAEGLQKYFKPEYKVRTTARLEEIFPETPEYDWSFDFQNMLRAISVEFAYGWKVFALSKGNQTQWLISGMLFPDHDGETEGWIVFAQLEDIFPEAAQANQITAATK